MISSRGRCDFFSFFCSGSLFLQSLQWLFWNCGRRKSHEQEEWEKSWSDVFVASTTRHKKCRTISDVFVVQQDPKIPLWYCRGWGMGAFVNYHHFLFLFRISFLRERNQKSKLITRRGEGRRRWLGALSRSSRSCISISFCLLLFTSCLGRRGGEGGCWGEPESCSGISPALRGSVSGEHVGQTGTPPCLPNVATSSWFAPQPGWSAHRLLVQWSAASSAACVCKTHSLSGARVLACSGAACCRKVPPRLFANHRSETRLSAGSMQSLWWGGGLWWWWRWRWSLLRTNCQQAQCHYEEVEKVLGDLIIDDEKNVFACFLLLHIYQLY